MTTLLSHYDFSTIIIIYLVGYLIMLIGTIISAISENDEFTLADLLLCFIISTMSWMGIAWWLVSEGWSKFFCWLDSKVLWESDGRKKFRERREEKERESSLVRKNF